MLTLDANVFVAALKEDEPYSNECFKVLKRIPAELVLSEPSVVYQEVCGTLARKVGIDVADLAKRQLDLMIHPKLLFNCNKSFCISAYPLCYEYDIYAIDALYLKVALEINADLVSLDESFVKKVNAKGAAVKAYHPSELL